MLVRALSVRNDWSPSEGALCRSSFPSSHWAWGQAESQDEIFWVFFDCGFCYSSRSTGRNKSPSLPSWLFLLQPSPAQCQRTPLEPCRAPSSLRFMESSSLCGTLMTVYPFSQLLSHVVELLLGDLRMLSHSSLVSPYFYMC
jgi:hypothetical protein